MEEEFLRLEKEDQEEKEKKSAKLSTFKAIIKSAEENCVVPKYLCTIGHDSFVRALADLFDYNISDMRELLVKNALRVDLDQIGSDDDKRKEIVQTLEGLAKLQHCKIVLYHKPGSDSALTFKSENHMFEKSLLMLDWSHFEPCVDMEPNDVSKSNLDSWKEMKISINLLANLVQGDRLLDDYSRSLLSQLYKDVAILRKCEIKQVKIAVVGGIQAGKSSTVNSILNFRYVLEQSNDENGSCTGIIIQLTSCDVGSDKVLIKPIYFTEDELLKLLQEYRDLEKEINTPKEKNPQETPSTSHADRVKELEVLNMQLKMIFRYSKESGFDTQFLDSVQKILKSDSQSVLRNRDKVQSWLQVSNQHHWAILKKVELSSNFAEIPYGITLVDLPGINDINPFRRKIAKEELKGIDHIFYCINLDGGLQNEEHLKTFRDLHRYDPTLIFT